MFWRPIIHLGLVGEMRMHNGKNTPRFWIEENEKGEQRMQGQSGFASPRGLRGWPTSSSGRTVPRIWEAPASERIKTPRTAAQSGSWQVVASPSSPRPARWVARACDRTGHPFAGGRFLPHQGRGAGQPLAFFLRVLAREEMAWQPGPG